MIASKQIAENYVETGRKKAELPVSHMLILGFFAGMFIALAGAGASVASGAFWAQPAKARTMQRVKSIAKNFFIAFLLYNCRPFRERFYDLMIIQ